MDSSIKVNGPLVLNQMSLGSNGGTNKRHTSVEPNSGNQLIKPALIPNGINNGRVYRRQSSDV